MRSPSPERALEQQLRSLSEQKRDSLADHDQLNTSAIERSPAQHTHASSDRQQATLSRSSTSSHSHPSGSSSSNARTPTNNNSNNNLGSPPAPRLVKTDSELSNHS